jgi:hypothetical protein
VKQSKRVTGRRISVLVTLTMIAVFGSLAPASASPSASATTAPAAEPMSYLGCLNYLIGDGAKLTRLRALFCAWATLDPSIARGVPICTSGLVFTGVGAITATAACTRGAAPGITSSTQSGIRRAGASSNPASFELTSGARIASSAGSRPAEAEAACAVYFEGSKGYRLSSEPTARYGQPGALLTALSSTAGRAWAAISAASTVHGWTARTTPSSRGMALTEPMNGADTAPTPLNRGGPGSSATAGPYHRTRATAASTRRQARAKTGKRQPGPATQTPRHYHASRKD